VGAEGVATLTPHVQGLHSINAILLIAVNGLAALVGLVYYRRRTEPRRAFTHLLALGQTLLVAQAALGLLLLSDDQRSSDRLHYLYGALALGAVLAPWIYAPQEARARLLWFCGAALLAAALGVRAYLTGS
jgi:hypothetical protein